MTVPRQQPSNTAALVVLAVVFCFTLATVALVHVFSEPGDDTGALVQTIIGTLGPTLAVVVVLMQITRDKADTTARMEQQEAKVDAIADDTHRLTNGLLDAKFRAGIADVVPHLVHPEAKPLVDEARRIRRENDPDVVEPERPLTAAEVDDLRGRGDTMR